MATFATFNRLKDRGLAAYRAGDFAAAKPFLIQAAESMLNLAEQSKDPAGQAEQQAYAKELIDLARECDRRTDEPRDPRQGQRDGGREGDDNGANAEDWIVRDRPNIRFSDVAGLDDVKEEIFLKMIYPFQHADLAKKYGINVGGGILLFGPPGTGKTMIAKAVAGELDATMFVMSPAQLLSKWVGEAEQNVRKLFEAAKQEPRSVIFIDEVESLVPSRRESNSTVMQRVVPQILQELEGFDRKTDRALLFMGATNEPWSLDPAMMRPGRLDARVYVPLPDAAARDKLLEIYLGKRPLDDDVAFPELVDALEGYSGADIKALAERSARVPFLESVAGGQPRSINRNDVLAVIASTPPSVSPREVRKYEEWLVAAE